MADKVKYRFKAHGVLIRQKHIWLVGPGDSFSKPVRCIRPGCELIRWYGPGELAVAREAGRLIGEET